jgi:hypothetical protein
MPDSTLMDYGSCDTNAPPFANRFTKIERARVTTAECAPSALSAALESVRRADSWDELQRVVRAVGDLDRASMEEAVRRLAEFERLSPEELDGVARLFVAHAALDELVRVAGSSEPNESKVVLPRLLMRYVEFAESDRLEVARRATLALEQLAQLSEADVRMEVAEAVAGVVEHDAGALRILRDLTRDEDGVVAEHATEILEDLEG